MDVRKLAYSYGQLKLQMSTLEAQTKAMKEEILMAMETCPLNDDGHQVLDGVDDFSVKAYCRGAWYASEKKARVVLTDEQFRSVFTFSKSTILDVRLTAAAKARSFGGR